MKHKLPLFRTILRMCQTTYPVKNEKDAKILKYILEQQKFEFDHELFKKLEVEVGERTLSTAKLPHTPLMRLILDFIGFEKTVKLLWRKREIIEEFIKAIEANDTKLERVIRSSPFQLVNFVDNMHHDLCSPPFFRKYVLPNYQRRRN